MSAIEILARGGIEALHHIVTGCQQPGAQNIDNHMESGAPSVGHRAFALIDRDGHEVRLVGRASIVSHAHRGKKKGQVENQDTGRLNGAEECAVDPFLSLSVFLIDQGQGEEGEAHGWPRPPGPWLFLAILGPPL